MHIPKNTICLWYDNDALEAATFYAETFPDSSVDAIHHAPGDAEPDKHADPERDKRDESLRRPPNLNRRLLIDVDLSRHKEEVVANAVQNDADVEHENQRLIVAKRKAGIPKRPRSHSDHQHFLDAEPHKQKRHHEQKQHFRSLAKCHLARRVFHPDVIEKWIRPVVIKCQWNADQKRADHEHCK